MSISMVRNVGMGATALGLLGGSAGLGAAATHGVNRMVTDQPGIGPAAHAAVGLSEMSAGMSVVAGSMLLAPHATSKPILAGLMLLGAAGIGATAVGIFEAIQPIAR